MHAFSKVDGSQSLDLQRDALIASGVEENQIYSDLASGKKDDRSGLDACLKALREGDVLVVWNVNASVTSTTGSNTR
ncbi:recombinase family protein [Primorskyibacter marinus]|uniref:Resolvase, N terminal domain n=1 Tax=Primorskyibacter flagellatus TaxID=1387277 RepID=A0A1W2ETC1_9RHOB|nr:Resolvase, N terminal domain [Primorskyibacter flagellatus]